jgi:Na+/proline symporter
MFLHVLDWLVVTLYLAFIAGIGIAAGLKVKDTGHYFLGNRRFSKWLMIGQSFGVGTHAEMPVSLAGAVYSLGFSGIWYQWKNLFATPFYWIMAPVFRRVRRTTMSEMMEDRYGPWMGAVYSVFALAFLALNTASMLKGAGKVIHQAVGGAVDVNSIILAMTVVFILYSFIGGLVSAAWTDFFQGFLIIALSFLLIPLGWDYVGGLVGMRHTLAGHRFSLTTPEGVGVGFIAVLTLNGLIGIMAQPHILAAVGTGKNEASCREGFFYGTFLKRVCTVGWALVGLMVSALTAQGTFGTSSLADPEDAFGFACRHLLFPGALGLLIASILAANMSACSAFLVDSGALFTQGIYRRWFRLSKTDGHYLLVGRISGLLLTLLGVIYGMFFVERVLFSFLLTETLSTFMGISILGGIVWRRANRWGAVSSLIVSLATNFLLYAWRGQRLDRWEPQVFLTALLTGTAALIGASYLTHPEPAEQQNSFAERLRISSDVSEETWFDETGVVNSREATNIHQDGFRKSAEAGQQLLLVNLLHLDRGSMGVGFLRAYRTDLEGLVVGSALVAALIAFTWWLIRV